ncbi:MAG: AraC family transcriptional regulator [Spirochaetaceae bacterium]|jgi:AraC family transcriptional regulator|nr:AraC family transcriptional regulator [Spirochaetaceae bacterium]
MDWIKRMNDAIAYIEANLEFEINHVQAAKLAHCSVYHFQRVFSYMAGTSISEYIRRRRLTMAAVDLRNSDIKVIDAALKYGYNSPTAFTRAFQQFHGFAPSDTKAAGVTFTAYPPISFQITIKGVVALNYRLEQKEEIRVVGIKLATTTEDGRNLHEITDFWTQCNQNGDTAKVGALINKEPFGVLGVCVMPSSGGLEFDYFIAAPTDKPAPVGMAEYVIPAACYAIFTSIGPMPHALQDLTRRIFTEWLPSSGYEYGNGADIEVYSDGDTTAKDYTAEVWVPVVKK